MPFSRASRLAPVPHAACVARVRIRLGMLDPPTIVPYYNSTFNATRQNLDADHLALALTAATDGMTLLINRNRSLPLTLPRAATTPPGCQFVANTSAVAQRPPALAAIDASSASDCCALCQSSDGCAVFTWRPSAHGRRYSAGGTCWLAPASFRRARETNATLGICTRPAARRSQRLVVVGGQAADGFSLLGNYVDNIGPLVPPVSILSGLCSR